ncbi:hypothetical protein [Streptomyces sp. NPDC052291]|uniref:hypothetical protein n=1 Tax=Streptomyces sp. NPDC052291 TaxID=3161011 RepID=UPI00342ECD76
MADGQPTDAYRCGQLYAALAALERLGAPDGRAKLDNRTTRAKASENPRGTLKLHLPRVMSHLMRAQKSPRGGEAVKVFRSIPELLPRSRELPGSLNHAQRDDFLQGCLAQEKALGAAAR